jgi:large subunit ribosomal protein L22
MREVVRQIQGMNALQAQAVLAVVPRKGARFVAKTLKSAIANAENNKNAKPETLIVKEAVAGTASTLRRFTPKARGSAGPILKRNCHIKITLSDE